VFAVCNIFEAYSDDEKKEYECHVCMWILWWNTTVYILMSCSNSQWKKDTPDK
jgi:thiosulfate reductase cytochrome b subunit